MMQSSNGISGNDSATRRHVVASDADVMKPLGYRFAAYDVPDALAPGADFLAYAAPGRISEFYKLSEGRLAALHVWRGHMSAGAVPPPAFEELTNVFQGDHEIVLNCIAAGFREERPPNGPRRHRSGSRS